MKNTLQPSPSCGSCNNGDGIYAIFKTNWQKEAAMLNICETCARTFEGSLFDQLIKDEIVDEKTNLSTMSDSTLLSVFNEFRLEISKRHSESKIDEP